MKQYLDFLQHILTNGVSKTDRTGTGTTSVFGYQMRFDLQKGFPLVTTKKTSFHNIAHELLWFLSGSTNIKYLTDNRVNIWNQWADKDGNLGPVYGHQWRSWSGNPINYFDSGNNGAQQKPIDQIAKVIEDIKSTPDSRRLIVSAWNVGDLEEMALPPCHLLFQFYVVNNKLSCQLYQRSGDAFLGVPYNIASYALLTHIIAKITGYEVGEFIHTFGDAHIYNNHIDQVKLQLSRAPGILPTLNIPCVKDIGEYTFQDFELTNYNPQPAITAPIAI